VKYAYLVVILGFLLVYSRALTFVYVEGDDADAVAFHLATSQGINQSFRYHAGMDQFLHLLPRDETILRVAMIAMTSVAAVLLVLLILTLIFDWLPTLNNREKWIIAGAVLLASPEFFFFGLIYMPSVIAMDFVLGAHLLMRLVLAKSASGVTIREFVLIGFSVLLYGLGATVRWDIAVYGLVIFVDIFTQAAQRWREFGRIIGPIFLATLWPVLAIPIGLGFILLSGVQVTDLFGVVGSAREISSFPSSNVSIVSFARWQTFFTPAFLILMTLGVVSMLQERSRLLIVVLFGLLPVTPWFYSGIPKLILPAIPGLVLCEAKGLQVIMSLDSRTLNNAIRIVMSIVLILPWVVGVHVLSTETAWGPGFQVRTVDSDSEESNANFSGKDTASHGWSLGSQISLVIGDGLAVPTQEGPRPLGGFATVLLKSSWKQLVEELDAERLAAAKYAITNNIPILQEDTKQFIVTSMYRLGFARSAIRLEPGTRPFEIQFFSDALGRDRSIVYIHKFAALLDQDDFRRLVLLSTSHKFILYFDSSSNLRRLVARKPQAFRVLGPFSAVLNIDELP
jgi:hypothetical protein